MSEFNDLISGLWPSIRAPVSASVLLMTFRSIGSWLEKEATTEWKSAVQEFLKSGRWLTGSARALMATNSLFDKLFGNKYFSLIAFYRSAFITATTSILLTLMQIFVIQLDDSVHDAIVEQLSDLNNLLRTANRALVSLIFDYMSIMRIRFLLRQTIASRYFWSLAIFSPFLEFIVIIVCFTTIEWALSAIWRHYDFWPYMESLWHTQFRNLEIISFLKESLSLRWVDSPFFYASLIPVIIFLLFSLSIIVGKILSNLVQPVTWIASHLRFQKPFQVIFTLSGCIVSASWLLARQLL